jgi:hypothetical protein
LGLALGDYLGMLGKFLGDDWGGDAWGLALGSSKKFFEFFVIDLYVSKVTNFY